SSYAKDYEDNVIDFYDCDLSSIENSDVEDNLLSSFEKDTSIDNCIFYENQNKLKNVTNSIRNEQTSDNNLKIQNIGSSESYNNSTSVVEPPVSLIHSTSHDHQNNKIVSTSMSMKQIQINPDTDDKLESLNHSSVKINTFNEIPSFNDSNNVNILQSNNFCVDQAKLKNPEGLVVPLMPHQKHAIAWLIWRESQEPHGGILADDMGLGKTLSMISLILKLKEKPPKNSLPVVSIDNRRIDVIIGGTLVVCPASLINQWETEVKTKLKPGLLKVGQYYGVNRNFSALELAENDLVITSYHVVMWDYKIRQNTSPLYKIKWNRVILDEGHNIRNHKTQTSVAVCNIKSLNRWAITGTPIHNKEADFFTLLKFIRCKPFDDWPVWKRWVGNNDDAGKHRLSLLVKTLMLRRTKTELTQFTTFNLPPKEIITIEIELTTEERNAYEQLLTFSSNFFATYLYDRAAKEKLFDPSTQVQCKVQYFQEQSKDKEIALKDHPELLKLFKKFKNIEEIQTYHILVLLLRLQQMCCHP
ncbi:PREDICTED: transcription termination factor 2-like, partial [Diuraphis noxia]|uniref:transcription termination factor 2-like n=1 Tax=Diuraphis noxia TaxID=143948 RepID=UPI0007638A5B